MAEAAVSPASSTSAPMPAISAPQAEKGFAVVNLQPGTSAITLALPPKSQEPTFLGIEAPLWATIVTAAAVVVTAFVAIRNTNKQLDEAKKSATDARNDARQKALDDRVMAARREIYGEMLEAYQKVQVFIGGMAGENFSVEEGAVVAAMSVPVNKLWLWGDVDAVYEVREFYSQVNEFYQEALAIGLALRDARNWIKHHKDEELAKRQLAGQITQEIRALQTASLQQRQTPDWEAQNARLNAEHFQALRDAFEQSRLSSAIVFALLSEQNKYVDFVIDRQTALNEQVNRVMGLARIGIGMTGDVLKLNQQTHDMGDRVRSAVKKRKEDHFALVSKFLPQTPD